LGASAQTVTTAARLSAHVATTPLAHSGGFGEPTCLTCHLEFPLNPEGATLALRGLPERFEPGQTYRLRVELAGEGMALGGFQAAARIADGSQAGVLQPVDARVKVTDTLGVQYARHSSQGVAVTAPDFVAWDLAWVAPAEGAEVLFHVAANSANGDDSPLGDWVLAIQERLAFTRLNRSEHP